MNIWLILYMALWIIGVVIMVKDAESSDKQVITVFSSLIVLFIMYMAGIFTLL